MKLLFLGLLYNRDEEKDILTKSRSGLQNACNNYQWNLIDGFDSLLPEPVTIYSFLPVGTYPKHYRKLIFRTRQTFCREHSDDLVVGFINLPVLKQLSRYYAMKRRVDRFCRKHPKEKLTIITYSVYLPYLKLLVDLKKKYKNLSLCVIIPDLPNAFGYDPKEFILLTLMKKYLEKLQYLYTKAFDYYVLVTEAMAEVLPIHEKPYVVVEGICRIASVTSISSEPTPLIILLYYGALDRHFGIDKLLEAFYGIQNDNYRLWICGVGNYQHEIQNAAKRDQRITYYGYVTQEIIQNLQIQATILVNPRSNEGEYTKYSFPSKTINYMDSGRPVLCFKLDGIPKEYDPYLIYIKENTIDGIKEAILDATTKTKEELGEFGARAQNFIRLNKNPTAQAGKILSMLENPMRHLLQINITCQYGSTGKIVEAIHREIIQKGWKSSIAYSAYDSTLKEAFCIESIPENYMRRICNRYLGKKYIHSAPGTLRLIKNIKRLHPDIIQLHNIQQNSIHVPMLLKFLSEYGVPVVYTLHDCWSFTGGCYHFTKYHCNGYQRGCKVCPLPPSERDLCNMIPENVCTQKNIALHQLDQLCIVCVSKWLKQCAATSFMQDLPIKVIYNGINTKIFKPSICSLRNELNFTDQDYVILGVANQWDDGKGLQTFLKLAEQSGFSYHILLVGITLKNSHPLITTLPRIDSSYELSKIYGCADVFFNASKEETFGMTTAEALACGTPVITYASTACSEFITESVGRVLKDDSMDALLQAIESIKSEGKDALRTVCSDYIKKYYSEEIMIQNYLSTYDEMLQNKFRYNDSTMI